jgi:hypothetical protein
MSEPVKDPVIFRADQHRVLLWLIATDHIKEFPGASGPGVRCNDLIHRHLFLTDAP